MKILFDHGTPRSIARSLVEHDVTRAAQMGWHELTNGDLIRSAESPGFELLLSTDNKIRYQQTSWAVRLRLLSYQISNGRMCGFIWKG